jgi:lysophospholipase L1-like esterase
VRLQHLLRERAAPDVAVIIYGANDLFAGLVEGRSGFGPETARDNIRLMAQRLRAVGAVPIVALPVGTPAIRPQDAAEARRTLGILRPGFAELRALLHEERPHVDFRLVRHEHFVDALHPSPEGGALIARRVSAAIRRAMRDRARSGAP